MGLYKPKLKVRIIAKNYPTRNLTINASTQQISNTEIRLSKSGTPKVIDLNTEPTQIVTPTLFSDVSSTVKIGVILKSSSWIRVVVDGKIDFEGVLPQGTYRTWKAQDQLIIKTNNAGGVLVSVNQQIPKQMGEPGKVEELRITAAKQKEISGAQIKSL